MAHTVTKQHFYADANDDDEANAMNHNSTINCVSSFEETSLNEKSTSDFSIISPERLYFTGKDKSKGTRIWIQTSNDPMKYNLYAFDEQKYGEDYYKCIQCTRYQHRGHKPSIIKARLLENESLKIWEKSNHYPSCNHDKSFIDSIQKKYHRSSHTVPTTTSTSSFTSATVKKRASKTSSRGRPRKKRSSLGFKSSKKYAKKHNLLASNFASKDGKRSISGAFHSLQNIQQRPQTMSFVSSLLGEAKRERQDSVAQESVAITFSHLVSSFQTNDATMSQQNRFVLVSSTHQSAAAPLRSTRATTVPPQFSIPTFPSVKHSYNSQTSKAQRFLPKILSINESLYHCLPSTQDFREMLAILGIEFLPFYQVFWHSSYNINELNGSSRPVVIHEPGEERNFGFQALSLFLTSSEEAAFQVQEFVKRYIYKNYYNAAAQQVESYNILMKSALCSFYLENIHLWVLAKILNVRIVIFENEEIQVFGDTFNNSIPSILLKKSGEKCWPVLCVRNCDEV